MSKISPPIQDKIIDVLVFITEYANIVFGALSGLMISRGYWWQGVLILLAYCIGGMDAILMDERKKRKARKQRAKS